jgi:hypothetical protein
MTNSWKEKKIKEIVGLLRAYDLTETAFLSGSKNSQIHSR